MSPSFSVLCCRLSAKIATIILPNHVCHLNSSPASCWLPACHSAFSNFMQKAIMSEKVTNLSMFPFQNRIQYLPVFIYSPENFLIGNCWSFPFFSIPTFQRLQTFCLSESAMLHTVLHSRPSISFQIHFTSKQCLFLHKHFLRHLNSPLSIAH